jgi:hypothetical protein
MKNLHFNQRKWFVGGRLAPPLPASHDTVAKPFTPRQSTREAAHVPSLSGCFTPNPTAHPTATK